MNWDELKAQVDSAIHQEAVKVLDEAIARLTQLRTEYLTGTPSQTPVTDPVTPAALTDTDLPEMPTRTCVICGNPFTPRAPLSKTCSEECRKERYRAYRIKYKGAHKAPGQPRVCAVCGKEYTPDNPRERSITCSPECMRERIRQHDRARYGRTESATPVEAPKATAPIVDPAPKALAVRHCKTCGVQFMPTHHLQKNCPSHLTSTLARQRLKTNYVLTPEEQEWKDWADESRKKILERPDVVRMPKKAA